MYIAAVCIGVAIACALSAWVTHYLSDRVNTHRDELECSIVEIIAEMRKHPTQLYHTLVNKPLVDHNEMSSRVGVISIVTIAISEREQELVKLSHARDYAVLSILVRKAYLKVLPLIYNDEEPQR